MFSLSVLCPVVCAIPSNLFCFNFLLLLSVISLFFFSASASIYSFFFKLLLSLVCSISVFLETSFDSQFLYILLSFLFPASLYSLLFRLMLCSFHILYCHNDWIVQLKRQFLSTHCKDSHASNQKPWKPRHNQKLNEGRTQLFSFVFLPIFYTKK